jgi:hypothetical protein
VSMLNSKTKQKIEEVNCFVTSFKAECALSGTGWLYKQAQGSLDVVECAIYMYGLFMSYGLSLGNIQMAWGIVGHKNTLSLNIFLVGGFEDQWVAGEATRLLRTLNPAKTTEIFQDPSNRNKKKEWIRNELFSVEGRYNQVNMKLSLLERRLFCIQICLLLDIGVSPSCMVDSWWGISSQTLIREIRFLKILLSKETSNFPAIKTSRIVAITTNIGSNKCKRS